jgi:hypothetical protein
LGGVKRRASLVVGSRDRIYFLFRKEFMRLAVFACYAKASKQNGIARTSDAV